MERISVVIPTMNRFESLMQTINNLCAGSLLPDEIIIVDQTVDNSISRKIKKYLNNIVVKTIYIHQNKPSLTKARNTGMKYVQNDLVIQMDDDVDVKNDTLQNIVNIFSNKKIAMIAGINDRDKIGKSLGGYFFCKKSYKKRGIGHVTRGIYGRFPEVYINDQIDTEWAMGFFFVVRKSLIEKWNLAWDEKLEGYAYAEDLDFSHSYYLRAKEENLKCILSKRVVVTHNVSTEWREIPKKHTYMIILHREYLSYKFYKSPFYRLFTRWANFGEFIRRILKNEQPIDIIKAQLMCDRFRKDIKQGIFHYELFM